MIRLAVTDMDGCLLDGKGQLPADFGETFALMREKGVTFAAASGRSLGGVSGPFGAFADEMAFVTDNGSCAYLRGETLFRRTLPKEVFFPLLGEARKHENLRIIACGEREAWIEHVDRLTERDWTELHKYYPRWKDGVLEEITAPVIKYAFLYFDDIEKNIYPYLRPFAGETLSIQVTAYVWIDAYERGVDKGSGVKALQDRLGIAPEETVVFGDYLNDLSMADHAARSFAPANAHPEVRRRFTDTIGYNTEGCVTATLRQLLQEQPSSQTQSSL